MEIKCDAVARETKSSAKGFYRGVKVQDRWLNVWSKNDGALKAIKFGHRIEVTEPESYEGANGTGWSCWLQEPAKKSFTEQRTDKHQEATGMRFWAYMDTLKIAHDVAKDLEPDDQGDHFIDRSRARAAIVNTAMIAVADRKVDLAPEEDKREEAVPSDDGIPPPKDDDIPKWAQT